MYLLRIILAGLCGIIVGLERKNRSKEAGIRTHFVVACGAAIIMIVSKYAFSDAAEIARITGIGTEVRVDPSRIASTIASGIGFLGAGMIFVHKNTITGLTTAAGIWATSGIGMAIGSGMYILGIGATFVILLAQILLHINHKSNTTSETRQFIVYGVKDTDFRASIESKFKEKNITIQSVYIEKHESDKNYTFMLEIPTHILEEEIISMVDSNCTLKPVI